MAIYFLVKKEKLFSKNAFKRLTGIYIYDIIDTLCKNACMG